MRRWGSYVPQKVRTYAEWVGGERGQFASWTPMGFNVIERELLDECNTLIHMKDQRGTPIGRMALNEPAQPAPVRANQNYEFFPVQDIQVREAPFVEAEMPLYEEAMAQVAALQATIARMEAERDGFAAEFVKLQEKVEKRRTAEAALPPPGPVEGPARQQRPGNEGRTQEPAGAPAEPKGGTKEVEVEDLEVPVAPLKFSWDSHTARLDTFLVGLRKYLMSLFWFWSILLFCAQIFSAYMALLGVGMSEQFQLEFEWVTRGTYVCLATAGLIVINRWWTKPRGNQALTIEKTRELERASISVPDALMDAVRMKTHMKSRGGLYTKMAHQEAERWCRSHQIPESEWYNLCTAACVACIPMSPRERLTMQVLSDHGVADHNFRLDHYNSEGAIPNSLTSYIRSFAWYLTGGWKV